MVQGCRTNPSPPHPETPPNLHPKASLSWQEFAPIAAVPFCIDPARTPLIVGNCPRPQGCDYTPLPPGAYEYAARRHRLLRHDAWLPLEHSTDMAGQLPLHDPPAPVGRTRRCPDCDTVKNDDHRPVPLYGRVVLCTDDGACDVWDIDDVALVIPTALRRLTAPA